jgi:hypothetical protein
MQRVASFGEMIGLAVLGLIAVPTQTKAPDETDDDFTARILRCSPPVDLML